jgi:hypothetical protein
MAPEVKTAKNSKLSKLSENCFEPVGKGGWPLISIWIRYFAHFFLQYIGQPRGDSVDFGEIKAFGAFGSFLLH